MSNPEEVHPTHLDDAHRALLTCHQRLRVLVELPMKLVRPIGLLIDSEISALADEICAVLPQTYLLHEQDEELSLIPRLLRLHDRSVDKAVHTMCVQHANVDQPLANLVGTIQPLQRSPWKLRDLEATLEACATSTMKQLFGHFQLEEAAIFPAISRLSELERTDLYLEIRERRADQVGLPAGTS